MDSGSNTRSNNYDSNQQSDWLGHAAHAGQAIAAASHLLLSPAIKRCPGPNLLEWFTRALLGAWLQTILMVVVAVSICFEAIYSTKHSCSGQQRRNRCSIVQWLEYLKSWLKLVTNSNLLTVARCSFLLHRIFLHPSTATTVFWHMVKLTSAFIRGKIVLWNKVALTCAFIRGRLFSPNYNGYLQHQQCPVLALSAPHFRNIWSWSRAALCALLLSPTAFFCPAAACLSANSSDISSHQTETQQLQSSSRQSPLQRVKSDRGQPRLRSPQR